MRHYKIAASYGLPTSPAKLELLSCFRGLSSNISNRPRTLNLQPLSLYIHIPWCIKKCPYCDFNSHAATGILPEQEYCKALLDDLAADIDYFSIDRPLQSIFFGGGTPSLLSPQTIATLLNGVAKQIRFVDDIEITLEANPGTFESAKFKEFRNIGINRLSIGIQSFNDELLGRLGRVHGGQEALRAVDIARHAGFDNINLDLMFGLPGASLEDAANDINTAVSLVPGHISYYQLTLEPNTYFHTFPPRLPVDEVILDSQAYAQTLLAGHGFQHYEISAYAQAGRQCRHNLNYWQFGDYLGIGAGAHGKLTMGLPDKIIRTSKIKRPLDYISASSKNLTMGRIKIEDLPLEFVMNQLRLRQGFTLSTLQSATGLGKEALEPGLAECLSLGLLQLKESRYVCTERGWTFLDNVLQKFVC